MKRATRDFIETRQKHSERPLLIANVKRLGGRDENMCFDNATLEMHEKDAQVVSGWLILPYNKELDCTEIVQHWWNFDGNEHYDVTTLPHSDYEYLIDEDIGLFGQKNFDQLESMVCSSVLLKAGQFYAVEKSEDGKVSYRMLPDLSSEQLFAFEMKSLASINNMTDEDVERMREKLLALGPDGLKNMLGEFKKQST